MSDLLLVLAIALGIPAVWVGPWLVFGVRRHIVIARFSRAVEGFGHARGWRRLPADSSPAFGAKVDGLFVAISVSTPKLTMPRLRLEVLAPGPFAPGLRIVPSASSYTSDSDEDVLWYSLSHPDGAPIDERIGGDPALVHAALSGSVRRALGELGAVAEVSTEGLALLADIPDPGQFGRLDTLLRQMAVVASGLSFTAAEVPARLAANANQDSDIGTRRACLETLARLFHDTPEAMPAFRRALDSGSREIRLVGAKQLGAEGSAMVLATARDGEAETRLRLEALDHLLATGDAGAALAVRELLEATAPELRRGAISGAGRLQLDDLAPALLVLAAREDAGDDATQVALADAFGRIRDGAAEPFLLRMLERPSPLQVTAACAALARMGSLAAVEPLLAFERSALGAKLGVGRAARRAIQSRHGAHGSGKLTLSEPDARDGALTFPPESAEGGVSLPSRPRLPDTGLG